MSSRVSQIRERTKTATLGAWVIRGTVRCWLQAWALGVEACASPPWYWGSVFVGPFCARLEVRRPTTGRPVSKTPCPGEHVVPVIPFHGPQVVVLDAKDTRH
jgi:hypothetical protein